jgi:DNA-dependent RNA polymerase auxiliary subunit epsilon
MENRTTAASHKTSLADRTLWFDGDSSFDPNKLLRAMERYDVQFVDAINDTVLEYNKHSSKEQELTIKQQTRPLSFQWDIPQTFKTLNVQDHVFAKLLESTKGMPDDEFDERSLRVINELKLYESRGLYDALRAIIFVINTLTTSGAVWGVGRGSSVSSYVLYLIGAHDVDSHAYKLDVEDFLHD